MRDRRGNAGMKSGIAAPFSTVEVGLFMARFDALPPEHRRVLRDAAYNVDTHGLHALSVDDMRNRLAWLEKSSIAQTYGQDHPQAR